MMMVVIDEIQDPFCPSGSKIANKLLVKDIGFPGNLHYRLARPRFLVNESLMGKVPIHNMTLINACS